MIEVNDFDTVMPNPNKSQQWLDTPHLFLIDLTMSWRVAPSSSGGVPHPPAVDQVPRSRTVRRAG
jgi:hypothetical protein